MTRVKRWSNQCPDCGTSLMSPLKLFAITSLCCLPMAYIAWHSQKANEQWKWYSPCSTDYLKSSGWQELKGCSWPVKQAPRQECSSLLENRSFTEISVQDAKKWVSQFSAPANTHIYLVRALYLSNHLDTSNSPRRKMKLFEKMENLSIVYEDLGKNLQPHKFPLVVALKFKPKRLYVDPMSFG